MKLREAMKKAKETGKSQRVDEREPITETKINTSIRIDATVFAWLKAEAEKMGIPYQTYLNSILIRAMKTGSIEDRLSRIEKAVFKKTS